MQSSIFIARQPIFDANRILWGYELLFRQSQQAKAANITSPSRASSSVIADGYAIASEAVGRFTKLLVNFPERLLLEGAPLALPPQQCIPEILEDVNATPEVLAALHDLRLKGYTLALDDFAGAEEHRAFMPMVDIVKVDLLGTALDDLPEIVRNFRLHSKLLLAEKVEDERTLAVCKDLGFDLFQGYYFAKPEVLPGAMLPAGQIARLQIVEALAHSPTPRELANIFVSDPALTFRLLKHVNSPWYSFGKPVQSIQQAITLLGSDPIRKWLMAVLLADMNVCANAYDATLTALQRAHFLGSACHHAEECPFQPDLLFLTGLLSVLDTMLGVDMTTIVAQLPLDASVSNALLGKPSSLLPWLELASMLDNGMWQEADTRLAELGLAADTAAQAQAEAFRWATRVLASS